MATIGDLLPRSGLSMMDNPGLTRQPGPYEPSPEQAGLPPELEALRPKKRGTINDILGSVFDFMSAMGGGKANYWNDVNADQQDFRDVQARYGEEQRKRRSRLEEIAMEAQIKAQMGPEPTAQQRNFDWWNSLNSQQKQAFAQYQDTVQPDYFRGVDGLQYQQQRGGLPQGFDPDEWEVVPGGAGSGQPGFLGQ